MKLCTKSIKSYSTTATTNGTKTIKTTINEHDVQSVINFSLYIKSELRYNTIMNLNNIEREMSQAVYDRDGGKLNQIYIGFFRGTPILVQLMLIYFGIPYLLGGLDIFPPKVPMLGFTVPGALLAGLQ